MVKIAIIQYSTYGHVTLLAKAIQKGIEKEGGKADLFQIPETLDDEVLALIHAPPKPSDIPLATIETLQEYDAFLFGIPTRYGNIPSQVSAFFDTTGGLWATGGLYGKPYGLFVSTGTPGGGQEVTLRNVLSYFTHQGMIYIPLGYGKAFPELTNLEEVHGGSPWGAGAYAGGDGSRQPSDFELGIATIQGSYFYTKVQKFGLTDTTTDTTASVSVSKEADTKASEAASVPAAESSARKAQSSAANDPATEKASEGSKCCVIM